MSSEIETSASTDVSEQLETLKTTANTEHRLAEEAGLNMVQHAVNSGLALIQAKALVPRGEWLSWIDDNFAGAVRTAQRWMQVAVNASRTTHLATIQEALDVIAEHRPALPAAAGNPPAVDPQRLADLRRCAAAVVREYMNWIADPDPEVPADPEIVAALHEPIMGLVGL